MHQTRISFYTSVLEISPCFGFCVPLQDSVALSDLKVLKGMFFAVFPL